MPRKKKVEELPGYEKDTVTNAVINTNSSAFSNRRDQLQKLREKDNEIEQMKNDIEGKEREYWISRMGKQSAMEMLAMGKIQPGNLESIMHMPHEDQEKILRGALEYTKQFETGVVSIEKDVEQKLIGMLKENKDLDIVPKLEDTVQTNAKLLDSPKSKT